MGARIGAKMARTTKNTITISPTTPILDLMKSFVNRLRSERRFLPWDDTLSRYHPRVKESVQYVSDENCDDHHDGNDEEQRLLQREVQLHYCIEKGQTQSWIAEHRLRDDGARQDEADRQGEGCDYGEDGIPERVLEQDCPLRQPLRPGRQDVVLLHCIHHHSPLCQEDASYSGKRQGEKRQEERLQQALIEGPSRLQQCFSGHADVRRPGNVDLEKLEDGAQE